MMWITGLVFIGSAWLRMSGAIHLLPLCLYGIERNNASLYDIISISDTE
jgi:hypothetical protein